MDNNLLDKITGYTLPFLITQKYGFVYVPIMFLTQKITHRALEWFNNTFFNKEHHITVYETDMYGDTYWKSKNEYFNYISCFLETISNEINPRHMETVKTLDCDNSYLYDKKNKQITKKRPRIDIEQGETITISMTKYLKGNNKKIKIKPNTRSYGKEQMVRYYKIISPDKDGLQEFMDMVETNMKTFYENFYKDNEIKYFSYDTDKNLWKNHRINVKKTFNNLFLDKDVAEYIIRYIDDMLTDSDKYSKFGIPQKIGFLFYGVPGTGKTSTAYAIASKFGRDVYNLNINTSKAQLLEQARTIPNESIVCINDIDILDISNSRKQSKNTNKTENTLPEEKNNNDKKKCPENASLIDLLEILDGYHFFKKCIIIMTTNHIEKLDCALIRPGRIDHKIEYKLASHYQINQIMNYCYGITLGEEDLAKIPDNTISTSELINTIIIPNLSDLNFVRSKICC